ncbi:MAG: SRPBCC domain-containing protein [bacterium]|nr:SRPBCC domain-containing protein [bacterium]
MRIIKQTYQVDAPIKSVWKALVDPQYIEGWGGGPAKISDEVGTSFKLWGGDIYGKNLEVVSEKRLVQEWREGDWDKPSKVTFTLKEKDGGTQIELLHEDVPDEEAKDIDRGWNEYYLGAIKKYFEE